MDNVLMAGLSRQVSRVVPVGGVALALFGLLAVAGLCDAVQIGLEQSGPGKVNTPQIGRKIALVRRGKTDTAGKAHRPAAANAGLPAQSKRPAFKIADKIKPFKRQTFGRRRKPEARAAYPPRKR